MQQYFAKLRDAHDRAVLWGNFTRFFERHGVDRLYTVQDPPHGSTRIGRPLVGSHGLPQDWAQRYADTLFEHDPARRMALSHPAPFSWADIACRPDLDRKERIFCAAFEALGAGGGVFFPVFGPRGCNGYLAIFTGKPGPLNDGTLRNFQTIAQMSHQRSCELMEAETPERVALSPREAEILKWVARGKSNSSIAAILDISANTVDTHLRRIFSKLDVTDRTVAAIRGIGLGLIAP